MNGVQSMPISTSSPIFWAQDWDGSIRNWWNTFCDRRSGYWPWTRTRCVLVPLFSYGTTTLHRSLSRARSHAVLLGKRITSGSLLVFRNFYFYLTNSQPVVGRSKSPIGFFRKIRVAEAILPGISARRPAFSRLDSLESDHHHPPLDTMNVSRPETVQHREIG